MSPWTSAPVEYGETVSFNCNTSGGDGDVTVKWNINRKSASEYPFTSSSCAETGNSEMHCTLTIRTAMINPFDFLLQDNNRFAMVISCIVDQDLSQMAAIEERMSGDGRLEIRLPPSLQKYVTTLETFFTPTYTTGILSTFTVALPHPGELCLT